MTQTAHRLQWRDRLHQVIYESDTAAGKFFDVSLLVLIVSSIVVIMLDSDKSFHAEHGDFLRIVEWAFTILFTIEYILRLISLKKPAGYIFSWLGIIDLLSILPGYLSLLFPGSQSLLVLRALRLLRIFRIFKLAHFLSEMQFLSVAIMGSLRKISIFMLVVLTLVVIMGSVMYLVEGGRNGFESIADSIYWAIVTITTVGYGDISPVTPLGKFVASTIMLMGYAIIAVPTGIVTTEMALAMRNKQQVNQACPGCGKEGHDHNARFCKFCGEKL
ncbi:MAG: ion transporter [Chitinophagaceae bacterium]|nr:MAG: ion transporter [Chitinophagaceae bacterium]